MRRPVILVEVERLPRGTRKPQRLGVGWAGMSEPCAPYRALIWRLYRHGTDLEHAIRFLEERLGWTRPRVRHPGEADRWT